MPKLLIVLDFIDIHRCHVILISHHPSSFMYINFNQTLIYTTYDLSTTLFKSKNIVGVPLGLKIKTRFFALEGLMKSHERNMALSIPAIQNF